MNGGLISPSETKLVISPSETKLGGRIRPNGAATNIIGLRVVY